MASSSNIFASNVFYSGNVFGPSGEQLTQGAALTQKIQDLAGGFSNGIPGLMTSSSIVGTGMAQSALSPFTNALEGSIYAPNSATSYISAVNQTFNQNWKTNQMTAEGWFYFPSFSQGGSTFFGHYQPAGGGFDWTFNVSTGGVFTFYYWNGSVGNTATGPTLSVNTWYHLCVQSDGTNIFIFSNGTLSSTTAISGTPVITSTYPLVFGAYNSLAPPAFYVSSTRLTFSANLYSQGSFTTPTGPLGIAPTGQTVMLLRNPLYSAMTLKNPLNAQSSVRVRCLPSDALIYVDAFGSNLPNKAPTNYTPTFDPYGTGAVLFRSAQSQYLDFGSQIINVKTKGITAIMKVQMVLSPSNYERIFQFYGAPSSSVYIQLLRSATASGFYGVFNNGSGEGAIGYPSLAQDVPYVVAMRYDPLINTWSLWINGVISVINSSSTTTPNDFIAAQTLIGSSGPNMNLYTFAAYNRALTDKEITDASAMLNQVAPVVPSTVEIGNVNGRPSLTVDPTGSVNVLGPLNGVSGAAAPVDLGINSLSLATGNLTSNIAVTSFSPLGPTEGSLYFPGVANTYISFGTTGQPFSNSNIYAFGDFVVEAWVNPTGLTSTAFVNGGDPNTGSFWFFGTNATTGTIAWYSYLNGTPAALNTTASVTPGTWQHVAVIHQSSTKRIQIYINGAPQAISAGGTGFTVSGTVGSYTTGIVPALTNLVVGQNGPTQVFNGYLTNLRIVTGSGAAQIYNNNAFTPSTSPLFPASNTAGGSLTTRLLVRAPLTKGQTNISKIGPASGVLAFPPAPMTGYSTNLTGLSPYGQGTYVASASSEYSSGTPVWYAFTKSTSSGSPWASGATFSGSTPYASTATTTVDISGNSYQGEWIQIQQPSSIVLSSYSIINYIGDSLKGPGKWALLGSRDGANWFLLDSRSGVPWSSSTLTYTVSSGQAFTYLRLIVNQLTGGGTVVQMSGLIFNGQIEGLNINPDGKVGLGVVNPTRALEVAGDVVCAGTLSAGNPLMFRNALYNGDFRIAQRGTSFTNPSGQYTLDRWYISTYGAVGNGTVSQIQSGLANFSNAFQLATTSTTSGNWYISQSLETRDVVRFQGQAVTVSFWYKIPTSFTSTWSPALFWTTSVDTAITNAVSGSPNTAGSGNMPNTTAWTYTQFQAFVPSTAQALSVMFTTYNNTVNGATLQITGVQLEKGSVATPYEILPYATELALCQRYYQELPFGGSHFTGNGRCVLSVAGTNSSMCGTGIYFQVPMRANPAPTYYGAGTAPGNFTVYAGSSGTQTAFVQSSSNVATAQISTTMMATNIVTTAVTASGGSSVWYDMGWTGTYLGITLNAEL